MRGYRLITYVYAYIYIFMHEYVWICMNAYLHLFSCIFKRYIQNALHGRVVSGTICGSVWINENANEHQTNQ